jgi:hypothetical protein
MLGITVGIMQNNWMDLMLELMMAFDAGYVLGSTERVYTRLIT